MAFDAHRTLRPLAKNTGGLLERQRGVGANLGLVEVEEDVGGQLDRRLFRGLHDAIEILDLEDEVLRFENKILRLENQVAHIALGGKRGRGDEDCEKPQGKPWHGTRLSLKARR